jgi:hypothetical protein
MFTLIAPLFARFTSSCPRDDDVVPWTVIKAKAAGVRLNWYTCCHTGRYIFTLSGADNKQVRTTHPIDLLSHKTMPGGKASLTRCWS